MTTHIRYSRESKPEGWTKPRPPGYYVRAAERQRRWREANRELSKERGRIQEAKRRLRKYGMTLEDYNTMWDNQQHRCKICNTDTPGNKAWHLDHCHSKGHVRGILCHHYNLLLGNAKDNTETLGKAISYLRETA